MRLHINATRMELLKLKKRLAIATRGHKLLNDKLEGLMKEFLPLTKRYKEVRKFVDIELPEIIKRFILARITSSTEGTMAAVEQSKLKGTFTLEQKMILNTAIPFFSFEANELSQGQEQESKNDNTTAYSFLDTNSELDGAIIKLREFFPKILNLAELEQSLRIIAKEIGKTRRRVNALEYGVIPQMKESVKLIRNKLEEIERSNITRIMKMQ